MSKIDIETIIEELADNNEDAYAVCLFLYVYDDLDALRHLHHLGIKGEDLVTFIYECCPNQSLDYINQSIRFLLSGFLGKDEIENNLKSQNPVPFIPRLLVKGENWEHAYENFAGDFRMKSTPKKR